MPTQATLGWDHSDTVTQSQNKVQKTKVLNPNDYPFPSSTFSSIFSPLFLDKNSNVNSYHSELTKRKNWKDSPI